VPSGDTFIVIDEPAVTNNCPASASSKNKLAEPEKPFKPVL
jgi:hypothetical protein